ncbi:glutamate synthase large subunit [Fictibacillus enclensis]|uniref:glutamate synthase large subunit n=1 Tax=Fictibacillus enclensis TaxID=1017270 RepID=UPI0025A0ED10|nr:glutamate synthase large subunit [Fictibacillus enclensis]MDM5199191.1 glutamate synthase large subunit [Fictibacillus enclensis]
MTFHQLPKRQGLYRPEFEHDACGIGLYAHIKGLATHDIVKKGLSMLCQLDHRGGQGSDPLTGDGAGLMVQLPDAFFRENCKEFSLPEKGSYGVGMLFLPQSEEEQLIIKDKINRLIEQEGQVLLGWRSVPVIDEKIGILAQESCPSIHQVFIQASGEVKNGLPFERKLYLIRKQAESWGKDKDLRFYFSSLSSETIVYKGLLTPEQVDSFYVDLQNDAFVSAFALVHSRFSTNTFPSWERAHPNRYLIHNGEINTLRGNINWMKAREQQFASEAFGEDLAKLLPILDTEGSDSAVLDNALEFFVLAGRELAHAAMMLIPEPWSENNPHMTEEKKAFYEYHSTLMEPWDGPTAISFTNGRQIGAILDRNGLRPARYYVTKDDYIIFSSEVGVIDVEPENVLYKDRLSPGKMLLIDLEKGRIVSDKEIKSELSMANPYRKWLDENLIRLDDEGQPEEPETVDNMSLRQRAFGYTYEDVQKYLLPIVNEGKDPVGSMGNDTPLAVLSDRSQSLFNYFKQLFAQVTNPPIDSLREQVVTSTISYLGAEGNLLQTEAFNCRRIQLDTPILPSSTLDLLKQNLLPEFKSTTLHTLFSEDLESALNTLFTEAEKAIEEGHTLLILSDREMDEKRTPMPILLATSGLHHHLVRAGLRTKVSLIVDSGETREVHHYAALIGYGADAIHPYLAYATYQQAILDGHLEMSFDSVVKKYIKSVTDGVVKVMSKMGISTIQSYRGAQIFEAVGIGEDVIDRYFTGTASQIDGINLTTIAQEAVQRHGEAWDKRNTEALDSGSEFQWRKTGEHHAFNPKTIHTLQWACRRNDYDLFKQYSSAANEERLNFLRNLFSFPTGQAVPIEEVESVEDIVKRFKTGAMSFGSLSSEAHEALAIAMNRLGGKSNSGEGGEDASRYSPDENGDFRRSAIKQIASGRFGVKSHYLVNADELQIKMAQGAKPGEGGQLPGNKVYPWVADVRGSTPGVGLISPPPHHDIYSIEDLAQLIHDLKNSNRDARISVKLVAKAGVGTIAAGVVKGSADVIVISGYDGGTGASPKTSIKHTGLPWELGLAEAHQTLMLNGLRDRVVLETDGKLMTGKDVVLAALLGAEEYGFATAPLVVLGCVMMRACHLDTCPVGVATQNPELRKKFMGDPDHVVNYMRFVAQEVREIMAELGFRTIDEMVGRSDILEMSERAKHHWKAKQLNLNNLIHTVDGSVRTFQTPQNHKIDESLDITTILPAIEQALEEQERVYLSFNLNNTNRVTGTICGSEVSKRYGEEGLPEDTINLQFNGSAGQSFGAFIPKGMSLYLTGDANDYVGKGLSGGKIIVTAPKESDFLSDTNVIAGNVAFYGATSGEAYINGAAGERFAVRNSGANIVTEGIGDHGCEYMTGGKVVVLGETGKNFAAGMSGGVAYILASDKEAFLSLCNKESVEFESFATHEEEEEVRQMILSHYHYTLSPKAAIILSNWDEYASQFVKVIPKDYKQMIQRIAEQENSGKSHEEAVMSAFLESSTLKKSPSAERNQLILN